MLDLHQSEFVSLFRTIARQKHRYEVFKDFVTMSAISLHNSIAVSDELEQQYLQIINSYDKKDQLKFCELFSHVVMGLEARYCDFLGDVFMALELGSGDKGQFFTPYSVSQMMAKVQFGAVCKHLESRPFITVSEPACGAGGMIIAMAETMKEEGFNPQTQMFVHCMDIDHVACMMSYIQLSLLGIPAEVVTGNTLSLEWTSIIRTPFYYKDFWQSKLKRYWNKDKATESVSDVRKLENAEDVPITVDTCSEEQPLFVNVSRDGNRSEEGESGKPVLKIEEQMVLF